MNVQHPLVLGLIQGLSEFVQALILGLIQGLTEFIPVSSTGHLILAHKFSSLFSLNLTPRYPHTYDTFIQLGTVLPVLVYFREDWLRLLRAAGRLVRQRRLTDDMDERLVVYLLLGSIPAGVVGLALDDYIEALAQPENRWATLAIGLALIVVGLVMWWAENVGKKERTIDEVRMRDAWVVGAAQALALFPGVSRSGSTITAGLFLGLTREAAARFSFLLMTPIMLAATGYKGLKVLKGAEPMTGSEWAGMLFATLVAAITGYLAIRFLLAWLRSRTLASFAIYRIVLGIICLAVFFTQR